MNLPPQSMAWGRYIQETNAETAEAIDLQRNDANSAGSIFAARADLVAKQFTAVSNVSTQYTKEFPSYSRSKAAGSLNDPLVMLESDAMSFSPPKPTGSYRVLLFANMVARQTGGTGNLDFTWVYMSVSGRIYRQPVLQENRPGATGNSLDKIASVSAWDITSGGDPTIVKIGLLVGSEAKTIDFSGSSVTAVYVGAL